MGYSREVVSSCCAWLAGAGMLYQQLAPRQTCLRNVTSAGKYQQPEDHSLLQFIWPKLRMQIPETASSFILRPASYCLFRTE